MTKDDDLFAGLEVDGKIVSGTPAQPKQPATTDKYSDIFSGIEAVAQKRPRLEDFPEVGIGLEKFLEGTSITKQKAATLVPLLMVTTDPMEFANILKAAVPELIITEEPDTPVITNPITKEVRPVNKPGVSPIDILQAGGLMTAFAGPGAAATMPARIGGAMALESGIQGAQAATGGKFDIEDVAMSGAGAVAGELLVPTVKSAGQIIKQGRQAKELGTSKAQLTESAIPAATEALVAQRQLEKLTGEKARLFPAQISMVPSELMKQRVLPQLEASAPIAMRQLEHQNKEIYDLTLAVIEKNLPPNLAVNAEKRTRDAAKNFGDILDAHRSEQFVNDINNAVRAATEKQTIVNVNKTENLLQKLKIGFRPNAPTKKLLDKLDEALMEAKSEIVEGSNILPLHRFKLEISQAVAAHEKRHGPLDLEAKRATAKLYDVLAKDLRNASDEYNTAMQNFINTTPEIENYQASLAGTISQLSDQNLLNIASRIFDPRRSTQEILAAKKVIEASDPEAWQGIVAKWLDMKIGGITQQIGEQGTELVQNLPGRMYREIFGNAKQRRLLYRSLNPEQKQNFRYLEVVLRRAGAGRAEGSPTAAFLQVINNIKGVFGHVKDFLTGGGTFVAGKVSDSVFNMKIKALAKAAYDPEFSPLFNDIIKLPANSKDAPTRMTKLLNEVQDSMTATTRGGGQVLTEAYENNEQ